MVGLGWYDMCKVALTRPALSSLSIGRSGLDEGLGRKRSDGLTNEVA